MTKPQFKSKLKIMVLLVALFQLILVGFAWAQPTKKLELGAFHTISVNSDFNVIIRQSNKQEVEAKVDAEIWHLCNIWVDNGVLHVDMKPEPAGKKSVLNKLETIKGYQMDLYVTVESLKKIIANGDGKITSENSINATNFEIEVNGNGKVDIDVKATNVKAAIYSEGELTMSGYTTALNLLAAGAGKFNGISFDAKTVTADVHGSDTSCQVSVSQTLKVTLNGDGELFYKGNPGDVKKFIYGKGKVLSR
ncbi:MAG: DUF2807 domain-containing protein [Cyclobacteriaceae bacterium]|nr:DUF2807 domain-containing protein [Cyclobacteriaceae bacterium]